MTIFPDWSSLEQIRSAHNVLELAALIAFGLLVVFDVLAHVFDDPKALEKRLAAAGLWFFALAVVLELFAYQYSRRSDFLSVQSDVAQRNKIALLENSTQGLKTQAALEMKRARLAEARIAEAEKDTAKAKLELAWIQQPRTLAVAPSMYDKLKRFKGTPFVIWTAQDSDSISLASAVVSVLVGSCEWEQRPPPSGLLTIGIGAKYQAPLGFSRPGVHTQSGIGQLDAWGAVHSMFEASGIWAIGGGGNQNLPIEQQTPMQIMIGEKPKQREDVQELRREALRAAERVARARKKQ